MTRRNKFVSCSIEEWKVVMMVQERDPAGGGAMMKMREGEKGEIL
jgi:hypothetical protein